MMDWNTAIVQSLAAARTDTGLSFFSVITEFGGIAVVVVVLVASVCVLWRGRACAHAIGLIVALGGAITVSMLLKHLFQFSRPDLVLHAVIENGSSFPSNHATAAMALYGFLAWCVWEKYPRWRIPATIFFGVLILLIGFSRFYLGVHFPIDVLAGFLLGAIFVWIGTKVTRRSERFEN